MNVEYLISHINDIVVYLASGFLFIKVFLFVSNGDDDATKNSHYLLPSIVSSFIIKEIVDTITPELYINHSHLYNLILLLISIVLGIILGRASKTGWFEKLVVFFTKSTAQGDYWDSEFSDRAIYTIDYGKDGLTYCGIILAMESKQRLPLVTMTDYYTLKDGELKDDFTGSQDHRVILDLAFADKITKIIKKKT